MCIVLLVIITVASQSVGVKHEFDIYGIKLNLNEMHVQRATKLYQLALLTHSSLAESLLVYFYPSQDRGFASFHSFNAASLYPSRYLLLAMTIDERANNTIYTMDTLYLQCLSLNCKQQQPLIANNRQNIKQPSLIRTKHRQTKQQEKEIRTRFLEAEASIKLIMRIHTKGSHHFHISLQ